MSWLSKAKQIIFENIELFSDLQIAAGGPGLGMSGQMMIDQWNQRFPEENISDMNESEFYNYLANHECKFHYEKFLCKFR